MLGSRRSECNKKRDEQLQGAGKLNAPGTIVGIQAENPFAARCMGTRIQPTPDIRATRRLRIAPRSLHSGFCT